MMYIYTSSQFYFISFRLNKCVLQLKRLSNNMNVVFDKPAPIFRVYTTLPGYSRFYTFKRLENNLKF